MYVSSKSQFFEKCFYFFHVTVPKVNIRVFFDKIVSRRFRYLTNRVNSESNFVSFSVKKRSLFAHVPFICSPIASKSSL